MFLIFSKLGKDLPSVISAYWIIPSLSITKADRLEKWVIPAKSSSKSTPKDLLTTLLKSEPRGKFKLFSFENLSKTKGESTETPTTSAFSEV